MPFSWKSKLFIKSFRFAFLSTRERRVASLSFPPKRSFRHQRHSLSHVIAESAETNSGNDRSETSNVPFIHSFSSLARSQTFGLIISTSFTRCRRRRLLNKSAAVHVASYRPSLQRANLVETLNLNWSKYLSSSFWRSRFVYFSPPRLPRWCLCEMKKKIVFKSHTFAYSFSVLINISCRSVCIETFFPRSGLSLLLVLNDVIAWSNFWLRQTGEREECNRCRVNSA